MLRITLLILAFMACGNVGTLAQAPLRPQVSKLLDYYDSIYDSRQQMLRIVDATPGYHSQLPPETTIHPVRESFYYALALLQRARHTASSDVLDRADVIRADVIRADVFRAEQILARVLPFQGTRQTRHGYGVWPWYLEEPLAEMPSIDPNWADFCGAAIAQMLTEHEDQLTPKLASLMRDALGHAALSIQRRDVKPAYTNIAVLGGGVCAVAGELLDAEWMLDYGRERLQDVVFYTQDQGGFNEYNSPPYGKVVIAECERILQLAHDESVKHAADSLRCTAWKMIAHSFHPSTQQWAGPHSRTSRTRLRGTMVDFINERLPQPIQTHPSMQTELPRGYAVVDPLPCPDEFHAFFRRGPDKGVQRKRTFILPRGKRVATVGTTWLQPEACFGTVNQASFWTQRKPVIAYWNTPDDPAVVFGVRCLHDGRDFASMAVKTTQEKTRTLSLFHSLTDRGDWHRSLDRPKDGHFKASDLRIRCELQGVGVGARAVGKGHFVLEAGDFQMLVSTADSRFLQRDVRWEFGSKDDSAFVDAILYSGAQRDFDFSREVEMTVALGLALQAKADRGASASRASPAFDSSGTQVSWRVAGQQLQVDR